MTTRSPIGASARRARRLWSNREILWRLNPFIGLRNDFVINLDRLVSLASQGLLVSVDKS